MFIILPACSRLDSQYIIFKLLTTLKMQAKYVEVFVEIQIPVETFSLLCNLENKLKQRQGIEYPCWQYF